LIPLETISKLDPDACPTLLASIFANIPTGLAVIDPNLNYVWVNELFATYTGVSASEHVGKPVRDVLGETSWRQREPLILKAASGHASMDHSLDKPAASPLESVLLVKTSYFPLVSSEKCIGVLAIVVDHTPIVSAETRALQEAIKQRQIHEQELLKHEERLKLALRSGKLGTWQFDFSTEQFIDVSDTCKHSFGYLPGEAFTYAEFLQSVHPDEINQVEKAVVSSRDSGCAYDVEYRTIWRDGSEHWISATAQPTFNESGKPLTLIGISQDISHRKIAEREKNELLTKIREFALMQAAFLRDVLASVTDGKLRLCQLARELPSKGKPASAKVNLSAELGLRELRISAKEAALQQGFSDERWQDLITAVSEAGMNAVVHAGGGFAQVFLCGDDCVQVWVTDNGKGIDLENLPRATLEKGYTTTGTMGHGMKMMLQTSDRVWLLTGPSGTTLVIEQDRDIPRRGWY
jgi:PAS domain S-box-containing protein